MVLERLPNCLHCFVRPACISNHFVGKIPPISILPILIIISNPCDCLTDFLHAALRGPMGWFVQWDESLHGLVRSVECRPVMFLTWLQLVPYSECFSIGFYDRTHLQLLSRQYVDVTLLLSYLISIQRDCIDDFLHGCSGHSNRPAHSIGWSLACPSQRYE